MDVVCSKHDFDELHGECRPCSLLERSRNPAYGATGSFRSEKAEFSMFSLLTYKKPLDGRKEEKMRDITSILDQYQAGASEQRLNLFLECPSLRGEFLRIEQDQASAGSARASKMLTRQIRTSKSVFDPFRDAWSAIIGLWSI